MKTPQEKFENDPEYRYLVQMFEALIHEARFTPSEIRQAALFACCRYELYQLPRRVFIPKEVDTAIAVLRRFREQADTYE